MKKALFIAVTVAALAACSKSEVTPALSSADAEINYTVAPKVKAGNTDFNTSYTFKSTAYYLPADETWASHPNSTPKEYINNVDISWVSSESVWRNADKKYYWPKDGKLTFFAWTSLKETVGTSVGAETYAVSYISGAAFNTTNGVKITDFDITADANKNTDVLVAVPKYDQNSNLDSDQLYREGVATLFKHKLSKVLFTAKTDKDYKTAKNGGITFTINSIKFVKLDSKGTYELLPSTSTGSEGWTNSETAAEQAYYAKGTTAFEATETVAYVYGETGQQYYYLPQTFDADKTDTDCFIVDYTIDYGNGTTENLKPVISLNSATASKALFPKWEMGYIYTINLTFSLDEILWDPAVQNWDDTSTAKVPIK